MKKNVLRNFTKSTGKHLCQSLFFNKVAGLRPATLLKKRLWHRCFPVNFVKFLRTPFLQNTSGRLLLSFEISKVFQTSSRSLCMFWSLNLCYVENTGLLNCFPQGKQRWNLMKKVQNLMWMMSVATNNVSKKVIRPFRLLNRKIQVLRVFKVFCQCALFFKEPFKCVLFERSN